MLLIGIKSHKISFGKTNPISNSVAYRYMLEAPHVVARLMGALAP
jgi:hypothetical protein